MQNSFCQYQVGSENFRNLKVNRGIGGGCRDKPKKQKSHLRGKSRLPQTQFPHTRIRAGNIVTCENKFLQQWNIDEKKSMKKEKIKHLKASRGFLLLIFLITRLNLLLHIFLLRSQFEVCLLQELSKKLFCWQIFNFHTSSAFCFFCWRSRASSGGAGFLSPP